MASCHTVLFVTVAPCHPDGLLFPLRLRCHVLESVKPTVSPPKDSPVETGTSGQQELGTAVSFSGCLAPLQNFFFFFFTYCMFVH